MLPGEREARNSDRRRDETGAGCLWIILFTILIETSERNPGLQAGEG